MVVVTCGAVVCRASGALWFVVCSSSLFVSLSLCLSPPLPHSFDLFASLPACCVLLLQTFFTSLPPHSHAVLRAVGTVGAFIGVVVAAVKILGQVVRDRSRQRMEEVVKLTIRNSSELSCHQILIGGELG